MKNAEIKIFIEECLRGFNAEGSDELYYTDPNRFFYISGLEKAYGIIYDLLETTDSDNTDNG